MVVGGDVIGTSVAYYLAHLGREVLLLECAKLTSAATWLARCRADVTFGSTPEPRPTSRPG
jgi:4-methylaminobutanoate oxidase (formaldehyde-forming)